MERKIIKTVQGFPTIDGAGVHLVRVLGNSTVKDFSPILMLDSFDSTNPKDYTAGFPMHPHRGIETVSYVVSGTMRHRDSLGSQDSISDGEVQWMTAGSGILHEEKIPASGRLLGVQLWLNLPAAEKMTSPAYHSVRHADIPEIALDGGLIRVLTGNYDGTAGRQSDHLPLDYYDVRLDAGASLKIKTDETRSFMLFTLLGGVRVSGTDVREKTAAKLSGGDSVTLESTGGEARILFMGSTPLNEPVAWGGPIVMNTEKELSTAFGELQKGTFLKTGISYED